MIFLGILFITIGFILNIDVIAVILVGTFITGLIGGLSFLEIFQLLGSSFVKYRYLLMIILVLPVISGLEKKGLKNRIGSLMQEIKGSNVPLISSLYLFIRMVLASLHISPGGVAGMIRPIIYPMAIGSLKVKTIPKSVDELIKSNVSMTENIGNFFAQNLFLGSGGVLLIASVLESNEITVTPLELVQAALLPAIYSYIYGCLKLIWIGIKIKRLIK